MNMKTYIKDKGIPAWHVPNYINFRKHETNKEKAKLSNEIKLCITHAQQAHKEDRKQRNSINWH